MPNPEVVPPGVAQYSVCVSGGGALAMAAAFDELELPAELLDEVPGRRHQYLVSTLCALAALRGLAPTHPAATLGRQPGGAPLWPAGFVGSITHTEDFASAAVSRARHASSVGINSESVVSAPRASGILRRRVWPCEVMETRRAGCTRLEGITLIDAAKKSTFKCLLPHIGRRFSADDFRIVAVHGQDGTFDARIVKSLSNEFHASRVLTGRFAIIGHHVHTGMVLPPNRQ